jgi:hypothetical protein
MGFAPLSSRRLLAAFVAVAALAAVLVARPPGVAAVSFPDWVVGLGDSYMSGEAGRWAGNADDPGMVDALGSGAYDDSGSGDSIPGCHRARSAEIAIGVADAVNLACAGAGTETAPYSPGSDFAPGLDWYDDGHGHLGQAAALARFAATHRVRMVAVSIGGNEFDWGAVLRDCVTDFLRSPFWWKDYCHDDSEARHGFTAGVADSARDRIARALLTVRQAMAGDGYQDSAYTILVQTYPSPLPDGSQVRYSEHGYRRQLVGGCGLWNADLNWVNSTVMPTINRTVRAAAAQTGLSNIAVLDVADLFAGHRLCEKSDRKLQETSFRSWRDPGASDVSEWVQNIRTVTAALGPYDVAESLHPNYWGQLALRDCLRQAYNEGAARGGTCTVGSRGLNRYGEPITTLRVDSGGISGGGR